MSKPSIEQLQKELDAAKADLIAANQNNQILVNEKLTIQTELDNLKEKSSSELGEANTKIEQLQKDLEAAKALPNNEHKVEATNLQVSSSILSSSATKEELNKGLTLVEIQYPENHTGDKHFKDGDKKHMSKETADLLVKKGIAKIIE